MDGSKAKQAMLFFFFGLSVGGFTTVAVIREAVPLRDHVWAIGLSLVTGAPVIFLMFLWYRSLIKSLLLAFGQKGGSIISSILTFQIVATILIFLVIVSIFFAAIV